MVNGTTSTRFPSPRQRAWPLGGRGQWPVVFPYHLEYELFQQLLAIPGTMARGQRLACTWDVAPYVAEAMGVECPPVALDDTIESWEQEAHLYPGRDEWHALGLGERLRPYQIDDAFFTARRSMTWNCNPARSGKTRETLAAIVLQGVSKLLVLCPDIAKWGWAEEAAGFLRQDSAILYGRSARVARGPCLACNPTGKDMRAGFVLAADGTKTEARCPVCVKFDGTADGTWRAELRTLQCRGHAWKGEGVCPGCREDYTKRLKAARVVIVNYDIITPQKMRDAAGKVYFPSHLAGVPRRLSEVNFDAVCLDEGHELRGWSRATKTMGRTTRDHVRELIRGIPVCIVQTATPMMSGYVRDLISLLDLVSDGAMIDGPARKPFKALERYCAAFRGPHGLIDTGASELAFTELPGRLAQFTIRRDRAEIQPYLPRVIPKIVYCEAKKHVRESTRGCQQIDLSAFNATAQVDAAKGFENSELHAGLNARAEKKYTKIVRETIKDKVHAILNDARLEMLEGRKVLVFTYAKSSLFMLRKALLEMMASPNYRTAMHSVRAKLWCAHSDNTSGEERRFLGREFTQHDGAGLFLTTHDSFQVGASLEGASLVCVAELHYNADAMNQSLSRPMEGNQDSIGYNFYVVRDSHDERMIQRVLPKIDTTTAITGDKTTSTFFAAFEAEKPQLPQSLDEYISALTAGVDFSHGDVEAWGADDDDDED